MLRRMSDEFEKTCLDTWKENTEIPPHHFAAVLCSNVSKLLPPVRPEGRIFKATALCVPHHFIDKHQRLHTFRMHCFRSEKHVLGRSSDSETFNRTSSGRHATQHKRLVVGKEPGCLYVIVRRMCGTSIVEKYDDSVFPKKIRHKF